MVNPMIPEHTPLPTERISEYEFRKLAGLCLKCGIARKEDDSDYCEICARERRIQGKVA